MSELSYGTVEFSVSGWYDQVQIGYVSNNGKLDEDQDGPGFKLFGYHWEEVLVECVCWPSEGESDNRLTGWITRGSGGKGRTILNFSAIAPGKL